MRKPFQTLSLRGRLFLIAFTVILVPLLVSSFMLYKNTVSAYEQISIRAGEMSMLQASSAVEKLLSEVVKTADSIASDSRILQILEKGQSDYPAHERIEDMRTLRKLVGSFESVTNANCVRLVFPKKQLWLSNNAFTSIPLEELQTMFEDNGYQWPVDGFLHGAVWLSRAQISSNSAMYHSDDIAYVRMIRNTENFDQLLGYVVVTLQRSDINELLKKADVTEESILFLQDARGGVVAKSSEYTAQAAMLSAEVEELSQQLKDTPWSLTMKLPQHVYRLNVFSITLTTILMILLLTGLMMLAAAGMYRSTLQRIDRIVLCMEHVARQDRSARLKVVHKDELGTIEKHLNQMLDQLDLLEDQNRQMVETERLMRIQLLQQQVNPHFLYNTLNNILWTARDYKADKVCEMVKALSEFYKVGLQPGQEEASIADELLHVRKYIDLQNVRGVISLKLHIHVDDALWDLLVPNMLLQPIVENSVIHGFVGKREGNVTISITHKNSDLSIRVEDDGRGETDELFERLRLQSAPDKSYGLYSIKERLYLRYGERVNMQFARGKNERGFAVNITIQNYADHQACLKGTKHKS